MYSAVGAVGGLVFGLGQSGCKEAARGALAGMLGAALGSITYNVFHTIAFPLEWEFCPMPGTAGSRLLAHLVVAVCASTCVVVAASKEEGPFSFSLDGVKRRGHQRR
jgi:hypothetical protein